MRQPKRGKSPLPRFIGFDGNTLLHIYGIWTKYNGAALQREMISFLRRIGRKIF